MAYRRSHIPRFAELRKAIVHAAVPALLKAVERQAERAREEFIGRIEAQDFWSFRVVLYPDEAGVWGSGTNLSPRWILRKHLAGADLRTMIATGWYVSNIVVQSRKQRSASEPSMVYHVGFDHRVKARDLEGRIVADMPLDTLAKIHENGTLGGRVPARPHWRPQLNRIRRDANAMRDEVLAEVMQSMSRRAAVRPFLMRAR